MSATARPSVASTTCRLLFILIGIISELGRHVVTAATSTVLPHVHTGTMTLDCLSMCTCNLELSYMRCDNKNFTSVPPVSGNVTFDVEILNLSFNRLAVISTSSFMRAENVTMLHLEYNQISQIETGAFQHLRRLKHLYLHRNKLATLDSGMFLGLGRLTQLNLSQNAIREISSGMFTPLTRLNTLDLSKNKLAYLPDNISAFANLTNLLVLDLSNNGLRSLTRGMFSMLGSLKFLYLSRVKMKALDTNVFSPLRNLSELVFVGSSFETVVNPYGFNSLKHLTKLDLRWFPLKCDCAAIDLKEFTTLLHNRGVYTGVNPQTLTCQWRTGLKQTVKIIDLTCRQTHVFIKNKEEPYDPTYVIPYDPMLGWYTAATLSSLLVGFMIAVALDKLKNRLIIWRYHRQRKRGELDEEEAAHTPLEIRRLRSRRKSTRFSLTHGFINSDSEDSSDQERGEFESQCDSTINPEDQPIIPHSQPDQSTAASGGPRDANSNRRLSPTTRYKFKSGKMYHNTERRYKSDSNKNYTSQPCITEAVRPDTLPKLEVQHANPKIYIQKDCIANDKKDFFNMQVIEVHPDCPIHSPNSHKPNQIKVVESKV